MTYRDAVGLIARLYHACDKHGEPMFSEEEIDKLGPQFNDSIRSTSMDGNKMVVVRRNDKPEEFTYFESDPWFSRDSTETRHGD